jgi:hypothetical protein
MEEQSSNPLATDLVLGGVPGNAENVTSLVLGGIRGVEQRYYSAKTNQQKIAALAEAIAQGQKGLDLVIRSLRDRDAEISCAAYELLKQNPSPRAKLAIQLFSDRVNYQSLDELLKAKNWEQANLFTTEIMHHLSGAESSRALNKSHIELLDCRDLLIIDRLWQKYSGCRFGFGVQAKIWRECEASRWDPGEAWLLFGKKVKWYTDRWLKNPDLEFKLTTAVGHLPFGGGIFTVSAIADRLAQCHSK